MQIKDITYHYGPRARRWANATVMGSIPTRRNDIYLYFHFLRSGKVKRGVEFRHSTPNAPRIRRKSENGNVNGERSILILGPQVPSAYQKTTFNK